MRTLYNIIFSAGCVLAAPFYFLKLWRRGNWRPGFRQRFGQFDPKLKQSITNRHTLWIHAVSVGEVNLCTRLIRALEPLLPNIKIVVSTTTTTGMGELKKKLPSHIGKIYYPIDRRACVARALSTIHPEAVILVEAEIWPNFIWRAGDMRIPLFLANARLSERSYRGYKRFGFLFRPLFALFSGVGAQTESDAARLREIGFRPEAIQVVGSMKYDAARLDEFRRIDVRAMMRQLGAPEDALLLVAGSTHAGEEALLADIALRLKRRFPNLFLILVPRHFERSREVGGELDSRDVRFVYRSEMTSTVRHPPGSVDCLLVNTTGELRHFYAEAAVAFVGKSLLAHGGQNPIEPAALGKPIVFGPHMENFAEISEKFVKRNAARRVADAAELERTLEELLSSPESREAMGREAVRVVEENLGAVERTARMIVDHLRSKNLYVTPPVRST